MTTLSDIKDSWKARGFEATNDIDTHLFYLYHNRDVLVCEWTERKSTLLDSFTGQETVTTLEALESFLEDEANRFYKNPHLKTIRMDPYMPGSEILKLMRALERGFAGIPADQSHGEQARLYSQALNWIMAEHGQDMEDDEDED